VKVAIAKLAPHHLRRACARSCHTARGELEQIQFLLCHVSVQTTERYLGREQRIIPRDAAFSCGARLRQCGRAGQVPTSSENRLANHDAAVLLIARSVYLFANRPVTQALRASDATYV
jgi:hypothetical protein